MSKLLLRKEAIKWINEYYQEDGYVKLKVFRKDGTESYNVLIDTEDFDKVSQGQWYVSISRKNTHLKDIIKVFYTIDNPKTCYEIHQWILDSKRKNLIVDHIDRNRLNNRRKNLRFVSAKENSLNQERTGWSFNKQSEKYHTYISCDGNDFYLGSYITKEKAEEIYLKSYIIMGYDEISSFHKSRIEINKIALTDEDYKNIYLNQVITYKETGKVSNDLKSELEREFKKDYRKVLNSNFKGYRLGYNLDKPTNKYLVRINIHNKEVNIGRYSTEKEANEIYLKACIITNKNNESSYIQERIDKDNIILTENDLNNKYLKKVYNLYHKTDEEIPNGRFNNSYKENIDIIIGLRNEGNSWHKIALYLKNNIEGLEGAKSEIVKKYYLENYKDINKYINN